MLAAVAVLAFIYRDQLLEAALELRGLHPVALLALPFFFVWNLAASIGWHRVVAAAHPGRILPSSWQLSLIRIKAQTLNLLVPLGSIGGEVLRAADLSRRMGTGVRSTSTVVLDSLASTSAAIAFALAGLAIGATVYSFDGPPPALLVVIGGAVMALALALPFVVARLARRIRHRPNSRLGQLFELAKDEQGGLTRAVAASVGWHMAEKILTAGEIYVAIRALGIHASWLDALFVTAVMTGMTTLFFFIPAQVGAAELGVVSAFAAIGLAPVAGLSVALIRRARQIAVIATGATIWMLEGKRPT